MSVKILSRSYPGSLAECPGCTALLAYGPADVYLNHYIKCPICSERIKVAMDLSYDGLKEEPTT